MLGPPKIRRRIAALFIVAVTTAALTLTASTASFADVGNNYPGQWANAPQDSTVDNWGEYNRECTSWVAWALHDRNGFEMPFHDDATGWKADAIARGFTVDNTPAKGAVAWYSIGHVAYVESVNNDGTVNLSDYNYHYDGNYTYRPNQTPGSVTNYIHFKDITDTDGDGVADSQDACPNLFVVSVTGCPARADFSLDGRSDVAAFYRYDGGMTNLWLWNGQSNLVTSNPYAPWSQTTGWEASRLTPAGTADFNGDKTQDTAAFYTYDNGAVGLDVWYGTGPGSVIESQAWYVGSSWDGSRIIAAGAGDFNHDGRADIAAFYRYDGLVVNLYIWYGQADGTMTWPTTAWTGNGWDGTRIITVGVGDGDGDGNADISTFYRHDNGMIDQNVWYGNGAGAFTLGRPWHVDTGWDGSRFISGGITDLNADGKADTIAWYRHDNMQVDMRVWYGTSSRVGATDPGGPWTGFNGWDGTRMIPAGTGDYNGDGRPDIACFYRYDGLVVGLDIWYGDGAGSLNLIQGWYDDSSGWDGYRVIPAARG